MSIDVPCERWNAIERPSGAKAGQRSCTFGTAGVFSGTNATAKSAIAATKRRRLRTLVLRGLRGSGRRASVLHLVGSLFGFGFAKVALDDPQSEFDARGEATGGA